MIIGIDMGGTHSDGVLISRGEVLKKHKQLTETDNIQKSLLALLTALLENQNPSDIEKVVISTTLVTNTLSKNEEDPVGLFIIPGLGIHPERFFSDFSNVYVSKNGYIDHRGMEMARVEESELEKASEFFRAKQLKSIAVVSKFSPRNANQEDECAAYFRKKGFQSFCGARFSGKLNFPRRSNTTYLTAGIHRIYLQTIQEVEKKVRELGIIAPIYILKADGGAVLLSESLKYPAESVLSGPAASILGAFSFGDEFLKGDTLVLDIGGTTTDAGFFIEGKPLLEPSGIELGGLKTLIRALRVYPIGIGGDTVFSFSHNGVELNNKRQGVAYAFGGPVPTLTDVFLYLNEKNPKAKEGLLSVIQEADLNEKCQQIASTAISFLSKKIENIIKKINSQPIYTLDDFFHRRVFKPERIVLVGGGAPFFEQGLQKYWNIPVIQPEHFEICNALGAALSRVTAELNVFANTADQKLSIPELHYQGKAERSLSLSELKELALEKLEELARKKGGDSKNYEVTEASSFNVVRGFSTAGKNIRVKVQIKPGINRN